MKTPTAILKYLAHYATPCTQQASSIAAAMPFQADRCLIIPAFDEPPEFITEIPTPTNETLLIIVVVNAPQGCSATQRTNTLALAEHLKNLGEPIHLAEQDEITHLTKLEGNTVLLTLDITSQPQFLNYCDGVGFARRYGTDIALQLYVKGATNSPWFNISDADASLPVDYFSANPNNSDTQIAAQLYPFKHRQTATTNAQLSAQLYEISLRYYVLGLRWAASPWAYHTVGSTLVIHGLHYAMSRGFPTKSAGEDFYLLNKIAKTGNIVSLKSPILFLSDRASLRVPFGTGPAIERLNGYEHIDQEFLLYHPGIFTCLKSFHNQLPELFEHPLEHLAKSPFPALVSALTALGVEKPLAHCQASARDQNDFVKRFLQWFDGFKTLKLVHWLREHHFPSVTFGQWKNMLEQQDIEFLPWASSPEPHLSIQRINHYMLQQELASLPAMTGL